MTISKKTAIFFLSVASGCPIELKASPAVLDQAVAAAESNGHDQIIGYSSQGERVGNQFVFVRLQVQTNSLPISASQASNWRLTGGRVDSDSVNDTVRDPAIDDSPSGTARRRTVVDVDHDYRTDVPPVAPSARVREKKRNDDREGSENNRHQCTDQNIPVECQASDCHRCGLTGYLERSDLRFIASILLAALSAPITLLGVHSLLWRPRMAWKATGVVIIACGYWLLHTSVDIAIVVAP